MYLLSGAAAVLRHGEPSAPFTFHTSNVLKLVVRAPALKKKETLGDFLLQLEIHIKMIDSTPKSLGMGIYAPRLHVYIRIYQTRRYVDTYMMT